MMLRFLLAVALFLANLPLLAEEIPVKGEPIRVPLTRKTLDLKQRENSLSMVGLGSARASESVPKSLKSAPEFQKPVYYELQGMERQYLAVLDVSGDAAKLYIDFDGTGELDKLKPGVGVFEAENQRKGAASQFQQFQFGPIPLPQSPDFANASTIATAFCYQFAQEKNSFMTLAPGDYLSGMLVLPDGEYAVAFLGGKGVGWVVTAVDLERNGTFEGGLVYGDAMMRIGEKYYTVALLSDGTGAEFQEIAPQLGVLDSQCPGMRMSVASHRENSRICMAQLLPNQSGKWELPVGRYVQYLHALSKTDEQNREWKLQGDLRSKPREFEIKPGIPTVLEMGLPLKLGYTMEAGKEPGEVLIHLNLIGKGGESYSPRAQTGPDEWSSEPAQFIIYDESGKELAKGKFEYG